MSKKNVQKEVIDTSTLSKKELYDLTKKKKEMVKKKNSDNKKKKKKNNKTNLGAKIFAIVMLILMILSIAASSLAYFV